MGYQASSTPPNWIASFVATTLFIAVIAGVVFAVVYNWIDDEERRQSCEAYCTDSNLFYRYSSFYERCHCYDPKGKQW